jgi:hypothetical protein
VRKIRTFELRRLAASTCFNDRNPEQLEREVATWSSHRAVPKPVIRAGSCLAEGHRSLTPGIDSRGEFAAPRSHIRATYRNLFPQEARWQFSRLRLARDA